MKEKAFKKSSIEIFDLGQSDIIVTSPIIPDISEIPGIPLPDDDFGDDE